VAKNKPFRVASGLFGQQAQRTAQAAQLTQQALQFGQGFGAETFHIGSDHIHCCASGYAPGARATLQVPQRSRPEN